MTIAPQRWRFSVEDYFRLAEVGLLAPEDRTELIDGEIIKMAPIGAPHCGIVNRITRLFVIRFGDRVVVHVQNSVWLDPWSLPQPDVTLLRSREDFYGDALPEPGDVLLVVEVADSSLAFDRRTKVPLYARCGVPEVWVVSVPHGHVEVYRDLEGGTYASRRVLRRGETVAPAAFPTLEIPVQDIVGPAQLGRARKRETTSDP